MQFLVFNYLCMTILPEPQLSFNLCMLMCTLMWILLQSTSVGGRVNGLYHTLYIWNVAKFSLGSKIQTVNCVASLCVI